MLNLRNLKCILIISCVFLLSHCTKVSTENHLRVNPRIASPYTMPASAYIALAKNQTGKEKQSLLMMAAGRLIYDGQWQQGLSILSQMDALSAEQMNEKNLLLAKVDLIREQPQMAITHLANVHDSAALPIYYQVQFHEMLASAYQSIGHAEDAMAERIKLDALLPDEPSKANNRRALWLSLTTMPQPELDTLAVEATDNSILNGWVQLAVISRKHYTNAAMMVSQLEQWQIQYPHHPANYILPASLETMKQQLISSPKKMALLLPFTGPLAGPASAIKDGFMAAYEASGTADFVKVRLYNTNAVSVTALYQQAVADGAKYIVGPLSKADVAAVAGLHHPVPTLLLNDLDRSMTSNAYQFGLSPSNEARQVAAKARKRGLTRALVIAPSGSWGDEVAGAFISQWQANGGRVVDTLHYNARGDLNTAIRDFLHVSASESRGKQLKRLLGKTIEATPIRRQDFDMIFLLAYPSKARQLMPLLRYYYAGDVPVYATSAVYAGNLDTMRDRDLDGIIFCDMPWIFTHHMGHRNWPEQLNSYNRLYALGMDSYALSTQLNQLLLFPALGVSDKSGVLYLNPTQQIGRILVFGQFKQGAVHVLGGSHELN